MNQKAFIITIFVILGIVLLTGVSVIYFSDNINVGKAIATPKISSPITVPKPSSTKVTNLITPTRCVRPTDGMIIKKSTTFCRGTYNLPKGIQIHVSSKTPPIILDCNGATIKGDNILAFLNGSINHSVYWLNHSRIGIHVKNMDLLRNNQITIKNCNIQEYEIGIGVERVMNFNLNSNSISKTNQAIVIFDKSKYGKITENELFNNYYSGISADDSSHLNIFKNNIHDNMISYSYRWFDGESWRTGSKCPGVGIEVHNSHKNIIQWNNIQRMCVYGIFLYKEKDSQVNYNFVKDTFDSGMYSDNSQFIKITYNTIKLDHSNSIKLFYSTNYVVNKNNLYINLYRPDPIDEQGKYNNWDDQIIGNYYSDTSPTCQDTNKDFICDSPRRIEGTTGSIDNLPSKIPFLIFKSVTPSRARRNSYITLTLNEPPQGGNIINYYLNNQLKAQSGCLVAGNKITCRIPLWLTPGNYEIAFQDATGYTTNRWPLTIL